MYKNNSTQEKKKKNVDSRSSWSSSSCNNIIYTILILGIRMRDIHTNFQRSDAIFNNVGGRENIHSECSTNGKAKIKILENLHRRRVVQMYNVNERRTKKKQ